MSACEEALGAAKCNGCYQLVITLAMRDVVKRLSEVNGVCGSTDSKKEKKKKKAILKRGTKRSEIT